MTVVVKESSDLVVPPSVRRRAGIKPGDRLEFRVSGGTIHIVRESPSMGDELTRDQRAAIDKRLSAADDDIRRGRVYGPFSAAADLAASVEANIRKLHTAKRKARPAR
jgi:AbrB family looped-hinge helix DNA binding protein